MTVRSNSSLKGMLCLDLYAASRAVIKAYGPILGRLGLTYPQYLVLRALWANEPLAVKDLSALLSLDSGTLSPLLKRLESAGLVVRTRSKVDEREVSIALSEAGRSLEAKSQTVNDEIGCLFGMQVDEVQKLQQTLREIAERMDGSG